MRSTASALGRHKPKLWLHPRPLEAGGRLHSSLADSCERQSRDTSQHTDYIKLNVETGVRQLLVRISPRDPAGVIYLFPPIFTADEKQFLDSQARAFSVLCVADGLK